MLTGCERSSPNPAALASLHSTRQRASLQFPVAAAALPTDVAYTPLTTRQTIGRTPRRTQSLSDFSAKHSCCVCVPAAARTSRQGMARYAPLVAHILVALRSSAHPTQPAVSSAIHAQRSASEGALRSNPRPRTKSHTCCKPLLQPHPASALREPPRGSSSGPHGFARGRGVTHIAPPTAWQMWPFLGWPQMPHLYFERPVLFFSAAVDIFQQRPSPKLLEGVLMDINFVFAITARGSRASTAAGRR